MENGEKHVGLYPPKDENCPTQSNSFKRSARYNYKTMKDETIEGFKGFSNNLATLRTIKGISAREMSLSLGQSASYINDIENGKALPSMAMFFEICEYLNITPERFFEYASNSSRNVSSDLSIVMSKLSREDQYLLLEIAERMIKK